MMSRPPRTLAAFALSAALAAGSLAACGDDSPVTEDVYCADADGRVVDEARCDDGYRGGYPGAIWIGSFGSGHGPNYQLDRARASDIVPYNDPVARERAGLPRTGRVTGTGGLGGTVTRSKATSPNAGRGAAPKAGTSKGGGFGGGGAKGGAGS